MSIWKWFKTNFKQDRLTTKSSNPKGFVPWPSGEIPEHIQIQGDLMGIETDIAAVGHDIAVDAEAIAAKVKAEAEKIFAKAKVEAVAVEGTLAQEFTKVKIVVDSHAAILATKVESASKADLAAVEAKIDALIQKVGIKL